MLGEVRELTFDDQTLPTRQPCKVEIVEHHGFAISRELNVALDGKAMLDGSLRGRHRILDDTQRLVVEAAMGDRFGDKPAGRAH